MGDRRHLGSELRDLLLPRACVGCGSAGCWWCSDCEDLAGAGPATTSVAGVVVTAAAEYRPPVSELVLGFKERGITALRGPLAALMAAAIEALRVEVLPGRERALGPAGGYVLVPVPSSRRARFRRGFDALGTVTVAAAHMVGVPVLPALTWTRRVRPQKSLSPAGRATNVNGALGLRGAPQFDGRRAIVVDDVLTTGATIGEAVRALRAGGHPPVAGVVVCRHARRD